MLNTLMRIALGYITIGLVTAFVLTLIFILTEQFQGEDPRFKPTIEKWYGQSFKKKCKEELDYILAWPIVIVTVLYSVYKGIKGASTD